MARKKAKKIGVSPTPRQANGRKEARAWKLPPGYADLLEDLKSRVRAAQFKAALSANRELIQLYWDLGRLIVDRQERAGWGAGIIHRLARDLRKAFPDMQGFSLSNVSRMRAFYLAYTMPLPNSAQVVPNLKRANSAQLVPNLKTETPPPEMALLPWGHNIILLFKVADHHERLWYARQALEHGWSRAVLMVQIETGLYRRQGQAITNFAATLSPAQSDLAQLRHPEDKASIGLILCKTRERLVAEYALRDVAKPIGVAECHGPIFKS